MSLVANGLAMHRDFNGLKTKTMTAKEYLLEIGFDDAHLPELFNNDDKSYYQITELMEEYYKRKLKLLGVGDVVGQSEQLNAFVDWWHNLSQDELAWYEDRYVEVFLSL